MRCPSAGLLIAVAFAAGCGSTRNTLGPVDAGGSDGDPPADAALVDAGGSDSSDGGPLVDAPGFDAADAPGDGPADVPAPLVSFVFTNSTSRSIYIQISDFSTQGYWSLVEGGQRLPVDNTCETCDCSGCPSCAVCGRAIARVEELAPGAQHRWTWDRRIWERVSDGCRANLACEREQVIPVGAALEVAVTYSSSFAVDTSVGANDQFIGAPLTATATFTNALGVSIEITATQ